MIKKEQYLINYEKSLLGKLAANQKDLNKNILYSYSLTLIFILVDKGFLSKATIFGNSIALTSEQLIIIMPLAIMVPYIFINNTIRGIRQIKHLLLQNAKEIQLLNPTNARPFQPADLEFRSQGIVSLQLQFSKIDGKKLFAGQKF